MKKILMLLAAAVGLFGQTTLNYTTPLPVQGFGGAVIGTAGTTFDCYWVVAHYIGGGVMSANSVCFPNVPNTLNSSNYVQLSWQAANGQSVTYDVLKTTTNAPPAPGASSSLTTGITATTYNDQGGGLSTYTIPAFPYSSGAVLLSVNNRDFTLPAIECTGTVSNPCAASFGFIEVKPPLNVLRLGSLITPITIDSTGALYITQGSGTPGSAVGTTTAGGIFSVSANITLAQVNAGITILPAVTGQTYKVSHFLLTAVGGTTAGCTSVNISDTTGTPVNAAAVAIAALTSGVPVDETITGVTLTAFAPTALTASQGIQVRHVGSACTTSTSFNVTVYFSINS